MNGSGSFELVVKEGLAGIVEHVPELGCVNVVEVDAVIVEDVGDAGVVTVTIEVDCTGGVGEPGKHCQYQSFCLLHVAPETQVVEPVQPIPPPA